jgi:hypothetical protein
LAIASSNKDAKLDISEFGTFPNQRCSGQRAAVRPPARSPLPPQWTQPSYRAPALCPPSAATQHEHDTQAPPLLLPAPAAITSFKLIDWRYTTPPNIPLSTSCKHTSLRSTKTIPQRLTSSLSNTYPPASAALLDTPPAMSQHNSLQR